jgi:hypothetical protein
MGGRAADAALAHGRMAGEPRRASIPRSSVYDVA